jgi:hypothetical protein
MTLNLSLADNLWGFTARFGPVFNTRILWSDIVFTTNPDHIQRILATDFKNFVKGERFRSAMHSVLGVGVFNSDSMCRAFSFSH